MTLREPRARLDGVDEDIIAAMHDPSSPLLDQRERLAIEFADRLSSDHGSITQTLYAELLSHFTPAEVAEVTMLAQIFTGSGRLAEVLSRLSGG